MSKHLRIQVTQILIEAVIDSYAVGDAQFYRDIGLSEEQVNWLISRSSLELNEFCQSTIVNMLFEVKLDSNLFDLRRNEFLRQKAEKEQQKLLLLYGAPVSMMTYLYGLTNEDCAKLRKKLRISKTGRPTLLTEEQLSLTYARWRESVSQPVALRLIEIGEMGVCLSSAWPILYELIEGEFCPRAREMVS